MFSGKRPKFAATLAHNLHGLDALSFEKSGCDSASPRHAGIVRAS
jgi:hypothetical protein